MVTCFQCIEATAGDSQRETKFCGAWRAWDEDAGECRCAPFQHPNFVIECHNNYTRIVNGACATYDEESRATFVGPCPFDVHGVFFVKVSSLITAKNINLTSSECDPLSRTGVLCGECKPGLGPALLNYCHPCLECTSYGWLAYFAATLIPATLFFIVIVVFHIDATSPSLTYFILHGHFALAVLQQSPNFLKSVKSHSYAAYFKTLLTCYGSYSKFRFFQALYSILLW